MKKQMKLRAVARSMGLSAAYVSDLEHGKRNWNADLLKKFKEATK